MGLPVNTISSTPGTKNRIINGDMRISQRNVNNSVAANDASYAADRFKLGRSGGSSSVTIQRVSDAPAGFTYSIKALVGTGAAPASGDFFAFTQAIEGLNIEDFAFGNSSAKPISLSFWAKSSIAGVYAVALTNGGVSRSFVTTYTITTANAWQYVTVSLPGDIAGAWATDTTVGLRVYWDLGCGTVNNASVLNSWQSGSTLVSSSAATRIVSTTGASFQITGVQVELGTSATAFEKLHYGLQLTLCQRYFEKSYDLDTPVGTVTYSGMHGSIAINTADFYDLMGIRFKARMDFLSAPAMPEFLRTRLSELTTQRMRNFKERLWDNF
jgi:hypothetical protein